MYFLFLHENNKYQQGKFLWRKKKNVYLDTILIVSYMVCPEKMQITHSLIRVFPVN